MGMEGEPREEFFAGISPEVFATLKLGDEVIVKRSDGTWDIGWRVVTPENKGRLTVMKGNDKKVVGPEHLQTVSKLEAGAGDVARTQVFNQEDVERALFRPNDEVVFEGEDWKVMGVISEGDMKGKITIVRERGSEIESKLVNAGQLMPVGESGPEIRRMDDPRFVQFVVEQTSMENLKRALASNENGAITFERNKYDLNKILKGIQDLESRIYDPKITNEMADSLLAPDLLGGYIAAPEVIAKRVSELMRANRALGGGQKREAM